VKNRDTKLLNLDQDIQNLEKWFDGRKFVLERLFRASEDGFHSDQLMPKLHLKHDVLFVVESEHGQKFGGYTSSYLLENLNETVWLKDKQSFLFQLTK
jgi:hypothetical protein